MHIIRQYLTTLLMFSLPALVAAQPIHGHPQGKTNYASPSEWPTVSCQCHWIKAPEVLSDGSDSRAIIEAALTSAQHTHVDITAPIYSEINGLLRVPFVIKAFQTAGVITASLDRQETVTKIEWDDTGSETAPIMRGSPLPHRLVEWRGHITYDPRKKHSGHEFPPRGWYSPQFEVLTFFDTGDVTLQLALMSFYSMVDVATLEAPSFPIVSSRCYPHSVQINEWGTNYVEAESFLPLLPISQPWPLIVASTAYGGNELGDGFFEMRADLDLHGGNLGRLLSFQPEAGFNGPDRMPVLDPTTLGPGAHKVAFIWSKPRRGFEEIVTALLVVDVAVDPNAPPVQLCQDPTANNRGQRLPCTFDTPPSVCTPPAVLQSGLCILPSPILVWQSWGLGTWNLSFEREVDVTTGTATGRQRVCIGGQCIAVPL